jgi:hypothetical protein
MTILFFMTTTRSFHNKKMQCNANKKGKIMNLVMR